MLPHRCSMNRSWIASCRKRSDRAGAGVLQLLLTRAFSLVRQFSSDNNSDNNNNDSPLQDRGAQVDEVRARLQKSPTHGNNNNPSTTTTTADSDWDSLWKDGLTPWDLGGPTPALRSELDKKNLGSVVSHSSRSIRALVPGCGKGHDLVTLAKHYERLVQTGVVVDHTVTVVGLDISESALQQAAAELERTCVSTLKTNSCCTRVELVHGDFFNADSWTVKHAFGKEHHAGGEGQAPVQSHSSSKGSTGNDTGTTFDFIFDYTFFCALPPSLRTAWGKRTSQLLQPETGRLLTLMFPLIPVDDDKEFLQGPPFPVRVSDYQQALEQASVHMDSCPYASPDSVPARADMELVCWWTKRTTCSSL